MTAKGSRPHCSTDPHSFSKYIDEDSTPAPPRHTSTPPSQLCIPAPTPSSYQEALWIPRLASSKLITTVLTSATSKTLIEMAEKVLWLLPNHKPLIPSGPSTTPSSSVFQIIKTQHSRLPPRLKSVLPPSKLNRPTTLHLHRLYPPASKALLSSSCDPPLYIHQFPLSHFHFPESSDPYPCSSEEPKGICPIPHAPQTANLARLLHCTTLKNSA